MRAHEIPAAPAPLTTTRRSSSLLPAIFAAFISPAEAIIAVPCWSSWNTGMSHLSISSLSILKHSGPFISSRFIPPKVGAMAFTISISLSGSFSSTSMSNTSISANLLKRTPLPSITGLLASAPLSPRPRIAVPFEITATRFPLFVYLYAFSSSSSIFNTGFATPGVYARDSSSALLHGFVGTTESFPAIPPIL